jgi:hypothetical protein
LETELNCILALVVSCIFPALYFWRNKATCIHVHVLCAFCGEYSLQSFSLSPSTAFPLSVSLSLLHSTLLHQDPSLTFPSSALLLFSYHAIFSLSYFLTCSLLQPLIFYVYYYTRGRHSKFQFQITRGQQILAQMIGEKYPPALSQQSYNLPAPADVSEYNTQCTTQNTVFCISHIPVILEVVVTIVRHVDFSQSLWKCRLTELYILFIFKNYVTLGSTVMGNNE